MSDTHSFDMHLEWGEEDRLYCVTGTIYSPEPAIGIFNRQFEVKGVTRYKDPSNPSLGDMPMTGEELMYVHSEIDDNWEQYV